MRSTLLKAAFLSLLAVAPIRFIFYLFPDEPFWHFRELLDFPGWITQGLITAILSTDENDPARYTSGIDRVVNFIWLYVVIFLVVAIILTINTQRKNPVATAPGSDPDRVTD